MSAEQNTGSNAEVVIKSGTSLRLLGYYVQIDGDRFYMSASKGFGFIEGNVQTTIYDIAEAVPRAEVGWRQFPTAYSNPDLYDIRRDHNGSAGGNTLSELYDRIVDAVPEQRQRTIDTDPTTIEQQGEQS
jgi:hypothetical protein